jgi:hypothetical protein
VVGTCDSIHCTDNLLYLFTASLCPICLTSYNDILSEEEMAVAMDSPAHPIEELGVAKLAQSWQCGHIFCRRE